MKNIHNIHKIEIVPAGFRAFAYAFRNDEVRYEWSISAQNLKVYNPTNINGIWVSDYDHSIRNGTHSQFKAWVTFYKANPTFLPRNLRIVP